MANDNDIILKSLFTSEDEYTVLQLLNDFADKVDTYYTDSTNKFTEIDTLISAINATLEKINSGISIDDSGNVTFTKNFNVNTTYYGNVDTINSKTTGNALLRMYYDNGTYRCLVGSVVRPTTILGNTTRPYYAIDGDAFDTKELALYSDVTTSVANLTTLINGKQDKLQAGINIKNINGISLLGGGNIDVGSDTLYQHNLRLVQYPSGSDNESTGFISFTIISKNSNDMSIETNYGAAIFNIFTLLEYQDGIEINARLYGQYGSSYNNTLFALRVFSSDIVALVLLPNSYSEDEITWNASNQHLVALRDSVCPIK